MSKQVNLVIYLLSMVRNSAVCACVCVDRSQAFRPPQYYKVHIFMLTDKKQFIYPSHDELKLARSGKTIPRVQEFLLTLS